MVRIDTDESIKRATFGKSTSIDIARLRTFIDAAIDDFSTLSKEDYLLIIESSRRESRSIVQSFDREIKRVQGGHN